MLEVLHLKLLSAQRNRIIPSLRFVNPVLIRVDFLLLAWFHDSGSKFPCLLGIGKLNPHKTSRNVEEVEKLLFIFKIGFIKVVIHFEFKKQRTGHWMKELYDWGFVIPIEKEVEIALESGIYPICSIRSSGEKFHICVL